MKNRCSRRQFLQDAGIYLSLLNLPALAANTQPSNGQTASANPPAPNNILFFVADDMGADLGCLGNPDIKTPNLNALAAKGILFKNAFCTYASCSPSRTSILTGLWPHSHGTTQNVPNVFGLNTESRDFDITKQPWPKLAIPPTVPTLVEELKKAGYYTGITQKAHILPVARFPFDWWKSKFTTKDIETFFSQQPDKPFFLMLNYPSPHRPFNGHIRLHQGDLPDAKTVHLPPDLPDLPQVRQDWADYLTCIEVVDQIVGQTMEALKSSGRLDNTTIFIMGDNGPAFQRGKASTYPRGLRVPLIVSGCGVKSSPASQALVSLADLTPTAMEAAGLPPIKSAQGISLHPLLSGGHDWPRKLLVGEKSGSIVRKTVYQERAAFDGRWHYIRRYNRQSEPDYNADNFELSPWGNKTYQATIDAAQQFPEAYALLNRFLKERPAEELYDIQRDPFCLHDKSADKDSADILAQMRQALDAWLDKTSDSQMARSGQME